MEEEISPEKRKRAKEIAELFNDFEDSDFKRDFIAGDHSYVLVPTDNPEHAKEVTAFVQEAREHGENWLVIKASRGESGRYTQFSAMPSSEAEET